MKNLFIACLSLTLFTSAQAELTGNDSSLVKEQAFSVGERLEYRIHYGFLDAGIATLEVHDLVDRNGKKAYKISGKGKSVGMFDWFMKVRDNFETYIDADQILPLEFIRDIYEGGYTAEEHAIFSHEDNVVFPKENPQDTMAMPIGVQDLLSAFYYARTLDFSDLTYGDEFPVNVYLDRETFPMNLKYIGKAELETDFGTFKCLQFRPMVQEGRVFKEEDGMTIWVSDDENKIPIRVETALMVGSLRMDIISFKGITKPLNKF